MDPRIATTPARARTDVSAADPVDLTEPRETASAQRPAPPATTIAVGTVRRLGLGLSLGTLMWAASFFVFGPTAEGVGGRVGDLTALAFQLGLFGLLTVQMRTRAAGISRTARAMLKVEVVLLALASIWSLSHGVLPDGIRDQIWMQVLDVFWPLSMLGMFVIGVKLAFAGRWRGLLRWWPLIAESWAFVTVPAMALFGEGAARWVGGGHLLIGYAALGLLLYLRPELVFAAQERPAAGS